MPLDTSRERGYARRGSERPAAPARSDPQDTARERRPHMTDIGFLGLGAMGAVMARRLVRAGNRVTAWNRSPASAEALAQAGAIRATDAAEAIANPVVISMLADDTAAESVFTT